MGKKPHPRHTPWKIHKGDVLDKDFHMRYEASVYDPCFERYEKGGFVTEDDLREAVACVNALDGYHPDKLANLINEVEELLKLGNYAGLAKAMAELRGEE